MKWPLVVVVMLCACGGDDMQQQQGVTCTVTFTGDATGTDHCSVFLCYPTTNDYQDIDLSSSNATPVNYGLALDIASPRAFAVGTYSIADLRDSSDMSVRVGTKEYHARANANRTADEQATVNLTDVVAPVGSDVCNGYVRGTIEVKMVELMFGTPDVVGPGRATATVTIQ